MRYAVKYISGYLGFGVNAYERKYCESKEAAEELAEKMKAEGYIGVEVIRTM